MNVLLLGGTGAMGVHLADILSKGDTQVFITSRKKIKSKENLHYIQGNAKEMPFLVTVLSMHFWDAIIDFIGHDTEGFRERVELLLNATKHYVFLSSARVYASSSEPLTEMSPHLLNVSLDNDYLNTDEYALSKSRQENLLKMSNNRNWTIIRPYITYSESRLQLGVLEKEDWLYRALQGRTIIFSEDIIKKRTTLTYGFNVAEGIASIINNSNALSKAFHVTTNKTILWEDVLRIYLSTIEKTRGFKPKILFQNIDDFSICVENKYQIYYDRLFNRSFNNNSISKHLDIDSFVSPEIGLELCLEAFLKEPRFRTINWKKEAIKDRQTKEYTPLKEISGIKSKIIYLIFRLSLVKIN